MSEPIYTAVIADKLNNVVHAKEFNDEGEAYMFADQYPHSVHGQFSPKTYDVEWFVVFGVKVREGSSKTSEIGDYDE